MMEDTIKVCYCVPDFHGEKCQFQYDECLLGPRCMNGGTCLDGVDNFTCSCPPGLTGILCECLILDDDQLDCEYVSPTPLFENTTSTYITPTSQLYTIYSTSVETSTADSETSTSEDTTFKYKTTMLFTEEVTSVTNVPMSTWDQSSLSTLDNNNYTISFSSSQQSSEITTEYAETSTESASKPSSESTQTVYSTDSTTNSELFLTSAYPFNQSTTQMYMTSSDYQSTNLPYSTPFIYTRSSSTDKDEILKSTYSTDSNIILTTESTNTDTTERSTDSITTEGTTNEVLTTNDGTASSTVYSTAVNEEDLNTRFIPENMKTDSTSTSTMTTSTTESIELTTPPAVLTEEPSIPPTRDTTIMPSFDLETTSEMSSLFTESPLSSSASTFSYETTDQTYEYTSVSTVDPDCSKLECLNGGSCIHSTEGPKVSYQTSK